MTQSFTLDRAYEKSHPDFSNSQWHALWTIIWLIFIIYSFFLELFIYKIYCMAFSTVFNQWLLFMQYRPCFATHVWESIMKQICNVEDSGKKTSKMTAALADIHTKILPTLECFKLQRTVPVCLKQWESRLPAWHVPTQSMVCLLYLKLRFVSTTWLEAYWWNRLNTIWVQISSKTCTD